MKERAKFSDARIIQRTMDGWPDVIYGNYLAIDTRDKLPSNKFLSKQIDNEYINNAALNKLILIELMSIVWPVRSIIDAPALILMRKCPTTKKMNGAAQMM